jgi:glycosyltransferase involved in cell wall biosynthesis
MVMTRAIYSSEARKKFSAVLDRVQPDLVHLQNIHAHLTPSIILEAKARGLPVVWTLHDYKLICPNSHMLIDSSAQICEACGAGQFFQAVLKRCKKDSLLASGMAAVEAYIHKLMAVNGMVDAFLAPSQFLAQKLGEGGLTGNVRHLPLFLPDEMFQPRDWDQSYILFFGKLESIKGIFTLLEAARISRGVRILCAGRMNETEEGAIRGKFGRNIEYVGFKSGSELRELIQSSRAVVVPSLWYENQPFSILEAFAAGKAVIASDLGGMSELVNNRERGLLVQPGSPEQLASAMNWLYARPLDARVMGRAALQYAQVTHSSEVHYQSLMKVYNTYVRSET